jgi:hypothetical protein
MKAVCGSERNRAFLKGDLDFMIQASFSRVRARADDCVARIVVSSRVVAAVSITDKLGYRSPKH